MSDLLAGANWQVRQGDCIERLRELPDGCVQCCVTSPPYWGLRDYGTAEWEGGDPECNHQQDAPRFNGPKQTQAQVSGHASVAERNDRRRCPRCGARRVDAQFGLESTPEEYVARMVAVFGEVRRVLRDDGVLWLNLGDSYCGYHGNSKVPDDEAPSNKPGYSENMRPTSVGADGLKPKDLVGIPWRVAFALQADGWYLRSDIIWHKPNPMPESVTDRPTSAHEYVFLLSKAQRYYYDAVAVMEPAIQAGRVRADRIGGASWDCRQQHSEGGEFTGSAGRNRRDVWTIATQPFNEWEQTYHRVPVARDACDGDTMRITSPDCPVHASLENPGSIHVCGGRVGACSPRTRRSDDGLDLGRLADCAPTARSHEPAKTPCSSGCSDRQCSETATSHSSETHRTDRVPATSPACTASSQTRARTDDKSTSLGSSEQSDRTPENRSAVVASSDETATSPSAQTSSHSVRRSCSLPPDCICSLYRNETEKASHFATYPEALVEPCVLAGSSDRACPECGAAWVRQVKREVFDRSNARTYPTGISSHTNPTGKVPGSNTRGCPDPHPITTGFRPGCDCGTEHPIPQEELDADQALLDDYEVEPLAPVGSLVLDPFCGSGTTGAVAVRLGRRFLGIELNPEYVKMSERRIGKAERMRQPALFDAALLESDVTP